MFRKLLKHEWKSTGPLLGFLSLGALGIGVAGAVVLRVLIAYGEKPVESDSALTLMIPMLGLTLLLLFLGLIAYGIGTEIYLLIRFYKNKFTDEGYLTFTLPVNSHQIFLSSLAYILIWQVISIVTTLAAVVIAITFGTAQTGLVNTEAFTVMGEIGEVFIELFRTVGSEEYLVLTELKELFKWLAGILLMMTSVTVGAIITKRLKLLVAVGIYYGANMVIGMITGFISIFSMLAPTVWGISQQMTLITGVVIELLLQIGLALGGYFLSTYLMRKKLNLP